MNWARKATWLVQSHATDIRKDSKAGLWTVFFTLSSTSLLVVSPIFWFKSRVSEKWHHLWPLSRCCTCDPRWSTHLRPEARSVTFQADDVKSLGWRLPDWWMLSLSCLLLRRPRGPSEKDGWEDAKNLGQCPLELAEFFKMLSIFTTTHSPDKRATSCNFEFLY